MADVQNEPLLQMETTCGTLLYELQIIWDEVGESEKDRDKMLLELEQECLEVYRRRVDHANRSRAQQRQAIADSEAELAAICSAMGERPVHIRQYPSDPPYIGIIGSKGLNDKRQKLLTDSLHDKARELASYLMLVALCEEAVETLTSMNHPEGDCPLCLYPLVSDRVHSKSLPFMKLMSCFHCFHCECIIRWLKWIGNQNEANSGTPGAMSSVIGETQQALDICQMMGDNTENCPVCRKVFLAKDIEHILKSVDSRDVDTNADEKELREKLLECDFEKSRKERFKEILDVQQQCGGLIEQIEDELPTGAY